MAHSGWNTAFQKEAYLHVKQVFNCIFFILGVENLLFYSILKQSNRKRKVQRNFFQGAFIYYDLRGWQNCACGGGWG